MINSTFCFTAPISPESTLWGRDREVRQAFSSFNQGRIPFFYGVGGIGTTSILNKIVHNKRDTSVAVRTSALLFEYQSFTEQLDALKEFVVVDCGLPDYFKRKSLTEIIREVNNRHDKRLLLIIDDFEVHQGEDIVKYLLETRKTVDEFDMIMAGEYPLSRYGFLQGVGVYDPIRVRRLCSTSTAQHLAFGLIRNNIHVDKAEIESYVYGITAGIPRLIQLFGTAVLLYKDSYQFYTFDSRSNGVALEISCELGHFAFERIMSYPLPKMKEVLISLCEAPATRNELINRYDLSDEHLDLIIDYLSDACGVVCRDDGFLEVTPKIVTKYINGGVFF